MWRRQSGRDDRDVYRERGVEPHSSGSERYREDHRVDDRYSYCDQQGRMEQYDDLREVVQQRENQYDSYDRRAEYESRYIDDRRVGGDMDRRLDNSGRLETYPDSGYSHYGQERDTHDTRYDDAGLGDYRDDRYEDHKRADDRYDPVYEDERRENVDLRGHTEISGHLNVVRHFEYGHESSKEWTGDNSSYTTQNQSKYEDQGRRDDMRKTNNYREDRVQWRREDRRNVSMKDNASRGHSAGSRDRNQASGKESRNHVSRSNDHASRSKDTSGRSKTGSIKDRLGKRNEKTGDRYERDNRGNVRGKTDSKSGSVHQMSSKSNSTKKEADLSKSRSRSDLKSPSTHTSDRSKSTSAKTVEPSGRGRTSSRPEEKACTSTSSSRNASKQTSRQSSGNKSVPEHKDRSSSAKSSSKPDQNEDKERRRSGQRGHNIARQESQNKTDKRGDGNLKDVQADPKGASRHTDRKSQYGTQRSGGSDKKHDGSFLDSMNFHEDDVISIMVEDDAFASESSRFDRGERKGHGNDYDLSIDTPFQIHAESSASIFDDETSKPSKQSGSFKIPSKNVENKSRNSSRKNMTFKKVPTITRRTKNGWMKIPSKRYPFASNSSKGNRLGTSVSNNSSRFGKQRESMNVTARFNKFSNSTNRAFQENKGGRTGARSEIGKNDKGRLETGRTGAILKEDTHLKSNSSQDYVRYDNTSFQNDYAYSHEDSSRSHGYDESREMNPMERQERDNRRPAGNYNRNAKQSNGERGYYGNQASRSHSRDRHSNSSRDRHDRRIQMEDRHSNNVREQTDRHRSSRSYNVKGRSVYQNQSEKVKKKYLSSSYSKRRETASYRSKSTINNSKDNRLKGGSRRNRNVDQNTRNEPVMTHEDNMEQPGILPIDSNLPLTGGDLSQQIIFVPNQDMQGSQTQFVDQFGNVILNPDMGLQQGTAQPVPVQLAQPSVPPDVPPGTELIFIPFVNNQIQGYPENAVPVIGQSAAGGIHTDEADRLTRLERSVRPGFKPLTREQRARIKSRLLIKRRVKIEQEVEKKLLKKLYDESKAGKEAHDKGVRQKLIIKKISPPKSTPSAAMRKRTKLVNRESRAEPLAEVSDDESKYEKVSDFEDLTDDDIEIGGNERIRDKRHAFRKPGQPRFGSQSKSADIRKVVDRSGSDQRNKNPTPKNTNEFNTGQRRQRSTRYEEGSDAKGIKVSNSDRTKKNEGETEERRQRLYEKRPISPLEITVSNDHFSTEKRSNSRPSAYDEDRSPRYDRRANERILPKERQAYHERNDRPATKQLSQRGIEIEDYADDNVGFNDGDVRRGKYVERGENLSRNPRESNKFANKQDNRTNREDYGDRGRESSNRTFERDDKTRHERGNGPFPSNKRRHDENFDSPSQSKRSRPYSMSNERPNERYQQRRGNDFNSGEINQADPIEFSNNQDDQLDQQLQPEDSLAEHGLLTSQSMSLQQPSTQHKMQIVRTGTQLAVDFSQPPVQHNQMDVSPFSSPIVVGPDRSLPPPQGTLVRAQTSMPHIILQSQSASMQGQQQFQPQQIQQQGQLIQSSQQQLKPLQSQPLQQQSFQQQMPINNSTSRQSLFQTGVQQIHEHQPIFQTGIQSNQSSQRGMQTVKVVSGTQQPQATGTFVHPSVLQTQGQLQNVQQGNVPGGTLSKRAINAGPQNTGFRAQTAQQRMFVPTTPQQAVRGALRSSTGGGIRAIRPSGNQMQLRQGGRAVAFSGDTMNYGSISRNASNFSKGVGSMQSSGPTSTISRAPDRFEADTTVRMESGHMFEDVSEADFGQDDDLGELLCTKCDKVFLSDRYMRNHNLWHDHMESGYSDTRCDICKQSFLSSGAFNTHIAENHSMNSWSNDKCDLTLPNSVGLARHTKTTHSREMLHGEANTFAGAPYNRRYR